ncbi:hypothetical protein F383_18826 [Gossypium arboreum]|uniref:Uncharacterized protein n=1 Tax=Gossypium arboreum TaxID=29729 RepID=A0A0B0NVC8_GOSAR|nr:hypothetical protein F383_18826 [Gossypium arboreum]
MQYTHAYYTLKRHINTEIHIQKQKQ